MSRCMRPPMLASNGTSNERNREKAHCGHSLSRVLMRSCVVISVAFLSACAPFWPDLKKDKELATSDGGTCERPTSNPALDKAYACLEAARTEMIDLEVKAGHYERAINYTAVAAGTYAAYEATRTFVNNALIKHTAIAIGALVGFNQAIGADNQIVALDAGIDALVCVRTAADAISATDPSALSSNAVTIASEHAVAPQYGVFDSSQLSVVTQFVAMRSAVLATANSRLLGAISTAKANLPGDVYDAVRNIREQVRRKLGTKSVDVKAVFQQQQQSVSGMLGDIVKKSGEQQTATTMLLAISLDSTPAVPPAKEVQDAFHACVAPPADAN